MNREERVNKILKQDAELMKQMQNAKPEEIAVLRRQRNALKSKLNLFGPVAMRKWMRQEFADFFDEVVTQEERREQRWAKNPALLEKIRKLGET